MTQQDRVRAQKKLSEKDSDVNNLTTQLQFSKNLKPPTAPFFSTTSRSLSPPALTRKQRRQALLAQSLALEIATSAVPNSTSTSTSTPTPSSDTSDSSQDIKIVHTSLSNLTLSTLRNIPTMFLPIRLLICSIGNPPPYTNTLHSAGHTILSLLAPALGNSPFTKSSAHGHGLLSHGPTYTLWKSNSLMNISGVGVSAAWNAFRRETIPKECGLVVIHDELELPLGKIYVKPGTTSPKGHNGLKSIRDKLQGQPYIKIGIGIGRPESRDAEVVAKYVLRKMSEEEKRKIEGCVGMVMEELAHLHGGAHM